MRSGVLSTWSSTPVIVTVLVASHSAAAHLSVSDDTVATAASFEPTATFTAAVGRDLSATV